MPVMMPTLNVDMPRFSNGPKDLSEISQRSAFLSKSLFFTNKFVSLSFCFLPG